jgi:hypothetical protein
MRLTDYNNMSMAAVFLDIEKGFDTTCHPGLLHKLSKLQFLADFTKLISSFLSNRKFRVKVEGEMLHTPRNTSRGATRFCPGPYPVQLVYK